MSEESNSISTQKPLFGPLTIFLDIDGCIFKHRKSNTDIIFPREQSVVLPGVIDKINEWKVRGYYIVLTTGRPEKYRHLTVRELDDNRIVHDQLVMGLTNGVRYLINDRKGDGTHSAHAITIERDKGLGNINI